MRPRLHSCLPLRPHSTAIVASRLVSLRPIYGPRCSAASASADPTALEASMLVSLRSIRPQRFGSLVFGRPHGPRGLVACQPSTITAPAAPQFPLRPDSTAIVASLLVRLRPIRPQLLESLGFGRPHGPRGHAACQPSAYTAPAAPQPRLRPDSMTIVASLLVSFLPTRP